MRSSLRESTTPTLSPRLIMSRTWASWRPSSRFVSVLKGRCNCPHLLLMGHLLCFVCHFGCADGIAQSTDCARFPTSCCSSSWESRHVASFIADGVILRVITCTLNMHNVVRATQVLPLDHIPNFKHGLDLCSVEVRGFSLAASTIC